MKGSKWRRNTEAFSSRNIDPTLAVDSQCGGLRGLSANPGGLFSKTLMWESGRERLAPISPRPSLSLSRLDFSIFS